MKKLFTIVMFVVASLVFSSCELLEDEKTYSMKFKLDGVQKEFKTEGYGFLYDPKDPYWSCSWYEGDDEISISFNITPSVGITYTEPNSNCWFTYNTADDSISTATGFKITITQWGENKGDIQKGTFSGTLYNGQIITDGTFEADYSDDF